MKVYIGAYSGKGFGSSFIKKFTFGDISHVSLVFDKEDGSPLTEIESIQGKGVHQQDFVDSDDVHLLEFEQTPDQAVVIYQEAKSLLGTKYDWCGIYGLAVRRNTHSLKKLFCSELDAHCLKKAGIIALNMPSYKQVPYVFCASPVFSVKK